mgnify:CR=1 FL=1
MRSSTPRSASEAPRPSRRVTGGARLGDRVAQPLLGDRHLDQLLLVHLQRAVAAAQRHAPLAVAEHLDLVVARRLDVELDQHVLVVADAGRLHLGEDLAHRARAPAAASQKMRCPLPPPPPIAFRRKRRPGFSARRRAASVWMRLGRARRSRTGRCARAYDASSTRSAAAVSSTASSVSARHVEVVLFGARCRSALRSGYLRSSVRTVASLTPGVTETPVRDRRALGLVLGAGCRLRDTSTGPMKRRPASSSARTKCASSAMKP